MADQPFAIGFAVGLQSAFGAPNATIAGLSGALTSADGIVLGDRESGDFESGISLPDYARIEREQADVAGSFTRQPGSFLRVEASGLSISWQVKGNGATPTPTPGEAKPHPGIDALIEMAGYIGANGASGARYDYTPRHAGSSGGATRYGTVKLWAGGNAWVLQDCVVESLTFDETPASVIVATASIRVGNHDPASQFFAGVAFPTFDYGTQASLSAPVIEGVTTTYGTARGWQAMQQATSNAIDTVEDSAQVSGLRTRQTGREITAEGRLYVDAADPDFDYQELIRTTAPTADITVAIGTPSADPLNAVSIETRNLSLTSAKSEPEGDVSVWAISGRATATAAGGEALIRFE